MTAIDANLVKTLREKTGAGMMDCKKALAETGGDFDEAVAYLRKKGVDTANKKAGRSANEGLITSYIHTGGKIGVLVEINCETDFVARNEDFQTFTKDVAMHIAASAPQYVSVDEIPEDVIEKEKEIIRAQSEGKPENVIDKIVEGKIAKLGESLTLLGQPYIKNPDQSIQEYLTETIGKIGENIVIKRFTRFEIGE